jgi:hypothetical protein
MESIEDQDDVDSEIQIFQNEFQKLSIEKWLHSNWDYVRSYLWPMENLETTIYRKLVEQIIIYKDSVDDILGYAFELFKSRNHKVNYYSC